MIIFVYTLRRYIFGMLRNIVALVVVVLGVYFSYSSLSSPCILSFVIITMDTVFIAVRLHG